MTVPAPRRQLKDWIDGFLQYTDGLPTPPIFRLWAGIAALAGALERRLWMVTARKITYPHLYTILVSVPGVGKSVAIEVVSDLWHGVKGFKVSPDNMTKPSLIDALAEADRKMVLNPQTLIDYHSLLISSSEFGVLVPAHDLDFISVLNYIYDTPPAYRETRRTREQEDDIIKPQLNILAGTQPAYLANLLPEEAWGMGFMSRVVMIHSAIPIEVDLFDLPPLDLKLKSNLINDLTAISTLYGEITFNPEAKEETVQWHKTGLAPRPEHSKLTHYTSRRILVFLKLCMVSALSRSQALTVTLDDVNRARGWMLSAEETMPDVFKEMVQRSDGQVLQDLHFFAWQIYVRDRQPLHKVRLIHFLATRVPVEKVEKLLALAVDANFFERNAGTDLYTPNAKNLHGNEG